jgi:hypothetical protein
MTYILTKQTREHVTRVINDNINAIELTIDMHARANDRALVSEYATLRNVQIALLARHDTNTLTNDDLRNVASMLSEYRLTRACHELRTIARAR